MEDAMSEGDGPPVEGVAPGLARASFRFLQHVGLVPSSSSAVQFLPEQLEPEGFSAVLLKPLLSNDDASVLLGAIPPDLVPITLRHLAVRTPEPVEVLDLAARLALEPAFTAPLTALFAPLAPHFWGRWMEWLGFSPEAGEFRAGGEAAELEDVVKVLDAVIRTLPISGAVFPFLRLLLLHQSLATPPRDADASAVLRLYSLLRYLPTFPTSSMSRWPYPELVNEALATSADRGLRVLAWKVMSLWSGNTGKKAAHARTKHVWDSGRESFDAAPFPPYPAHLAAEYEREFGGDEGATALPDRVAGWRQQCLGQAEPVSGGFSVAIRSWAVDPWLAELTMDEWDQSDRREVEGSEEIWRLARLEGTSGLSPLVCTVGGSLLFREGIAAGSTHKHTKRDGPTHPSAPAASLRDVFVPVESAASALRELVASIARRAPTLLSSPPSSGKATLIEHLWAQVHADPATGRPTERSLQRPLVTINLADKSIDAKSLLGSLVTKGAGSGAEQGTFTFVEGPLTRAVRQGRWLVLEDVDKASLDVLTVVKVLAQRLWMAAEHVVGGGYAGGATEESGGVGVRLSGESSASGGGAKWVPAGEGFMLFATRTTDGRTGGLGSEFFGSHFFHHVSISQLQDGEVKRILENRFTALRSIAGLADRVIAVWRQLEALEQTKGRTVSLRDVIRWASRIDMFVPSDGRVLSIESNPIVQEEIFADACDIFLGSLPSRTQERYKLASAILMHGLGLSTERGEWCLTQRTPDIILPPPMEDDLGRSQQGTAKARQRRANIGRTDLPAASARRSISRTYALTKPSLVLLERLAVCLRMSEPVLMVGETGTGKTSAVQYLSELAGKNLVALNLSNQTEASDLIGGFKPIDEQEETRRAAAVLLERFVDLFGRTFNLAKNADFVKHVQKAFDKKRWPRLVGLWHESTKLAASRLRPSSAGTDSPRKRRKLQATDLESEWGAFTLSISAFEESCLRSSGRSRFIFSYVEGPLATAIRQGHWVLLDEINLATSETLESLSTLLSSPEGSLILTEQGDLEPIPRHPDFRLFACMNPATDVGKRDLPADLRSRFTELWVPPPDEDRDALIKIVDGYLGPSAVGDRSVILNVVELYSAIKDLAATASLADGTNHPPHYSMRTLARALTFASEFADIFGLRRAIYEGFVMSFTMLLEPTSCEKVMTLLHKHVVAGAKNPRTLLQTPSAKPQSSAGFVKFGPYWLQRGSREPQEPAHYILTASVQAKISDLARAVLSRKMPILIQGPTSSGKTSIIEYLAARTGHNFVRINNHEHTDIQEYIGSYVSDPSTGKLVFREGVLVHALRHGDWLVLDELNLAPTDVLEALNRLLDDNRELVIPETGEVVRPHPHFMLFATQNPPGLYGGRKVLSRAFRNRFLEIHFTDVPADELEVILCERCQIAPSYAKRMVAVFEELQRRRQAGRVFEEKQSFATLRDLFRWGGRAAVGYQQLAEDGFMLIAERARRAEDKAVVKEVIEQEMRVAIDESELYSFARLPELGLPPPPVGKDLVWNRAMRRLYVLLACALQRNEPVLLVGETGCGKTSVCQSFAQAAGRALHIIGCHQNTETADLIGGQRPTRDRTSTQGRLLAELERLAPGAVDRQASFEDQLLAVERLASSADGEAKAQFTALRSRMREASALFEWHDGPLVQAMVNADLFLLDEISLADDSVLERLNSVLEPGRTLLLAEKGGDDLADLAITASTGFQFLATMNPGGDYGKKELSPALRNRFTEIWVPLLDDRDDLTEIVASRLTLAPMVSYGPLILDYAEWFQEAMLQNGAHRLGLRDILSWVDFLNRTGSSGLPPAQAFVEGGVMVSVDGIGTQVNSAGQGREKIEQLQQLCHSRLCQLAGTTIDVVPPPQGFLVDREAGAVRFGEYSVPLGSLEGQESGFSFAAPTTARNAVRVLRALQLTKPVLLEGSPGVGKTSLSTALASATSNAIVRINLSDQTDLMDLFGGDLPAEGGSVGEFVWKDAPFLSAMQSGAWVLLDELNLASQSVLEGLNSCFDHRGTVYLPELDRTFSRHPNFRIFATQNPLAQGGGRKGLPKSFLNRFTSVYMQDLTFDDYATIAAHVAPATDRAVLEKMVTFVTALDQLTARDRAFGADGAPWEFNLRDVQRWLSLQDSIQALPPPARVAPYVDMLFVQRFRTAEDRRSVAALFQQVFDCELDLVTNPPLVLAQSCGQIGLTSFERRDSAYAARALSATTPPFALHRPLEALLKTVSLGWLAIITGAMGSGKTSLVRYAAAVTGHTLHDFSINGAVDTSDLLGSFQPRDPSFSSVKKLLKAQSVLRIEARSSTCDMDLSASCHAALAVLETATRCEEGPEAIRSLLVPHLPTIRLALQKCGQDEAQIASLLDLSSSQASEAARFQWIDGILIRAMKNGWWLLLEDANLCSPSVLDRLNSLFEARGAVQLNERGAVNGEVEMVQPHADFRVIMTLDPRRGELSRAMRNRGIEISLLPASESEAGEKARAGPLLHAGQQHALHVLATRQKSGQDSTHLGLFLPSPLRGLACRVLQAFRFDGAAQADFALRRLSCHGLGQGVPSAHNDDSTWLNPHDPLLREAAKWHCPPRSIDSSRALDILLSSYTAKSLDLERLSTIKHLPASSLTPWQRSVLASQGLLHDVEPEVEALFSLTRGLQVVLHELLQAPSHDLSSVALLCSYALQLEKIADVAELDVTALKVVLEWVDALLADLPPAMSERITAALAPLRSGLVLTSGLQMEQIWRAFLPYIPPRAEVAAVYSRLLSALAGPVVHAEDQVVSLLVEMAATLGSPLGETWSETKLAAVEQAVSRAIDALPAAVVDVEQDPESESTATGANVKVSYVLRQHLAAGALGPDSPERLEAALASSMSKNRRSIDLLLRLQQLLHARPITSRLCFALQLLAAWVADLSLPVEEGDSTGSVLHPLLVEATDAICSTKVASLEKLPRFREQLNRNIKLQLGVAGSHGVGRFEMLHTLLKAFHGALGGLLEAPSPSTPAATPGIAILEQHGSAFVDAGMHLWQAYVPNIPLDPVMPALLALELVSTEAARCEHLLHETTHAALQWSASRTTPKTSELEARLLELRTRAERLPLPAIQRRPSPVQLSSLFRELAAFRAQILDDERIARITSGQSSALELQGAVESIGNLLQRLQSSYALLGDVAQPACVALGLVKIGVSFAHQAAEAVADRAAASLLSSLTAFPRTAALPRLATELGALQPAAHGRILAYGKIEQLMALGQLSHATPWLLSRQLDDVVALYDQAYFLWTTDKEKAEAAEKEAGSLYKSKLDRFEAEEDEELQAREFAAMFPAFGDSDAVPPSTEESTPLAAQFWSDEAVADMATVHTALFGPPGSWPLAVAKVARRSRPTLVTSLVRARESDLEGGADRDSTVYRVGLLSRRLHSVSAGENAHDEVADFYTESNVRETSRVPPIMAALIARLEGICKIWPDQMVLHDLIERCRTVLALDADSPVAQVLASLEALLLHTQDWQKFSSREFSIEEHQTVVTNLIVDWRRLELRSWSRLMDKTKDAFSAQVARYWFIIFGSLRATLVAIDGGDDALTKLLDDFLSKSSLGQFEPRLRLVQSFAGLLESMAAANPTDVVKRTKNLLQSICLFYGQFLPQTVQKLASETAIVEKQVRDLIKITTWKDVNVYALKQSAIRSHHQLYKCVRKLRIALQKPASDSFVAAEGPRPAPCVLPEVDRTVPKTPALSREDGVAAHLVNMPATMARVAEMVGKALLPSSALDRAALLDETTVEIIERAAELRKARAVLTEEKEREKEIKHLMGLKRRGWVDLMRELKRIGFSPAPAPATVASLQSASFLHDRRSVLDPGEDLAVGPHQLAMGDLVRSNDSYYYRVMAQLPAVFGCPAQHHADVSTREVQRVVGSIVSSVHLAFTTREVAVAALRDLDSLAGIADKFKAVGASDATQPESALLHDASTLLVQTCQTREALTEAGAALSDLRQVVDKVEEQAIIKVQQVVEGSAAAAVSDAADYLNALLARAAAHDGSLVHPSDAVRLQDIHLQLAATREALAGLPRSSSCDYIVQPVLAFLQRIKESTPMAPVLDRAQRWQSLLEKHDALVNAVLVVMQKLAGFASQPDPTDELPDGGAALWSRLYSDATLALHLPTVVGLARDVSREAHGLLSANDELATHARGVLTRLAALLAQHTAVASEHVSRSLAWTRAGLKLSHVVSTLLCEIAAQGFCRPEDSEEGGDAKGDQKTSDGTGMGAGSGAKDVSDEIEDESQVEGLQGDVEEEQDKNEQQESKEGIEVSGDLDGALEDVPQDGSDDSGDDDSEKGDEDHEEQMDQVDPLDPGAVDEKLWGGEEGKDEADPVEQETQGQQKDEDVGAKEDDATEPKETGDAEGEQQEQPEEVQDADGDDPVGPDTEGQPEEANVDEQKMEETVAEETERLDLPDDMALDDNLGDGEEMDEGGDEDQEGLDEAGDAHSDTDGAGKPEDLASDAEGDDGEPDDADTAMLEDKAGEADDQQAEGDAGGDDVTAGENQAQTGGNASTDAATGEEERKSSAHASGAAAAGQDAEEEDSKAQETSTARQERTEAADSAAAAAAADGADQGAEPQPGSAGSRPPPNTTETKRELGDMAEEWQRRLDEMNIASKTDEQALPTDDAMDLGYVEEGDAAEGDKQALGTATEDQVQSMAALQLQDEVGDDIVVDNAEEEEVAPRRAAAPTTVDFGALKSSLDGVTGPSTTDVGGDLGDAPLAQAGDEDQERTGGATVAAPPVDDEVETAMLKWRSEERESLNAGEVWQLYESLTRDLSFTLSEQLRLILEPTKATRLKGDYRSGKRLNMKKIIPYIASDFTKDKIWLRRTKPSQREYQVLIAIDDSRSMADSHSIHLAFQSLALISRSLARLEAGQISVARFGSDVEVLHPFGQPTLAGASVLERFTFSQRTTDVRLLVQRSLEQLAEARATASTSAADLWQLVIIVSDGVCQDHDALRALLRKAKEDKVVFAFVVVDALGAAGESNSSITTLRSVAYVNGQMVLERYLSSFPFTTHIVLRTVDALPAALSELLRTFFQAVEV